MKGAGNTGTQGNIKVYRNWQQGLRATVQTLRNGHYAGILPRSAGATIRARSPRRSARARGARARRSSTRRSAARRPVRSDRAARATA
jgi:hypothetical protein